MTLVFLLDSFLNPDSDCKDFKLFVATFPSICLITCFIFPCRAEMDHYWTCFFQGEDGCGSNRVFKLVCLGNRDGGSVDP